MSVLFLSSLPYTVIYVIMLPIEVYAHFAPCKKGFSWGGLI